VSPLKVQQIDIHPSVHVKKAIPVMLVTIAHTHTHTCSCNNYALH